MNLVGTTLKWMLWSILPNMSIPPPVVNMSLNEMVANKYGCVCVTRVISYSRKNGKSLDEFTGMTRCVNLIRAR